VIRPDELKKSEPLTWSPGLGTDVWDLFCAVIGGDLETVRRLVAKDPSLVRSQYMYRTPIYFAVRENQVAVAAYLLERGADPLSLAVEDSLVDICRDRGHAEMERLLEEHNGVVLNASPRGEVLATAIRERDLAKVRSLLDGSPGLLHEGDSRGNQPIHWAAMTRQLDMIDELLARRADINARRFDGAHPIQLTNGDYHYRGWRDVPKEVGVTPAEVLAHLRSRGAYVDICTAASIGDLERVRALLDEDPSLANRPVEYVTYYAGSGTPLRNAAGRGHLEVVKLLLERGADPNFPEEHIAPHGHALYSAVYNKHHEIARLLLEKGAHPSPQVESSADALSIAIGNSDQKMVELLCSHGSASCVDLLAHHGDVRTAAAVFAANPLLADDPGAFSGAAGNGHEAFVRLMLRYRPDLASRVGVWAKTRELTELLFAHGMDPSHRDWLHVTPLHRFAARGDVEKAALFIDRGADLHARDEDIRSTPLGWAAKFGRLAMLELLLRHGAMPRLPDDPPWAVPLEWAVRRGHREVADRLREAERDAPPIR
jgi:ankyrin repeat protein